MRFYVEIETENAAFSDGNRGAEIARILRECADQIGDTEAGFTFERALRDINGNKVGVSGLTEV